MSGTFIVLEGPDGSGTTFHSAHLAESLRADGHAVLLAAEPTNGSIGMFIRSALRGDTIPSVRALELLFCADRAEHVETVIQPALNEGKIVVCDRYTPSTMIYGEALGIDPAWLKQLSDGFPAPHVVILAIPPLAVCLERIARRLERDILEEDTLQRKVYDLYKKFAHELPQGNTIDTSEDKQKTTERLLSIVRLELDVRGKK